MASRTHADCAHSAKRPRMGALGPPDDGACLVYVERVRLSDEAAIPGGERPCPFFCGRDGDTPVMSCSFENGKTAGLELRGVPPTEEAVRSVVEAVLALSGTDLEAVEVDTAAGRHIASLRCVFDEEIEL